MSFISVIWWPSSFAAILSTFCSALPYFAFMVSRERLALRKRLRKPLDSSSASKPFSSTTREAIISPTSPMSLVRTELRALSEKAAMFFWAAAPYCSTTWELVRSMLLANSSTCWRSSVLSMLISGPAGSAGAAGCAATAGTGASGVTLRSGVRVSFGIVVSSMVISPSPYRTLSGRSGPGWQASAP